MKIFKVWLNDLSTMQTTSLEILFCELLSGDKIRVN